MNTVERDSKGRFVKRPSVDRDSKDRFVKRLVTDVRVEPLESVSNIHVEKSESGPEKYQNLCTTVFVLLMFVGGIITTLCVSNYGPDIGKLSIIIYAVIIFGFRFWTHAKGYMKYPSKEERDAKKEAIRRKWDTPIKSAHIISLSIHNPQF